MYKTERSLGDRAMDLIQSFLLLAVLIPLTLCENCEPITVSTCADAGYRLTARFHDIDGEPYQDVHTDILNLFIPLLKICSKDASTILCSLYLPKCEEGKNTAIPPCREVCTKFVTDCQVLLGQAGLRGTFVALCDFLPDSGSDACFTPDNFNDTSSGGFPTDTCYDVVDNNCKNHLHYNKTFVPQKFQTAVETIFQSVINSNCSQKLEKFLCYTQLPPCNSSNLMSAFMPCKSMCQEIDKACWKEFKAAGFKLPHCDFLYPKEESKTGLCEIKKWPASWPKEFRPPPPALGTCEALTVKSCANAGYKYTAKYLPVDGIPFQKIKAPMLDGYLPYLQDCSPHSSLILCSLFLPKCVPGIGKPMLPCRQVCFDFAEKCKVQLRLASTAGMTVALCDLLPVYDGTANKCIMPDNFKLSSAAFSQRNVCHKVASTSRCTNDLHYNTTFLPARDQIASDVTIMDGVINSKCSPDIEKFLCFTRLPPCTADTTVVHLPCREFCERIMYDCLDVLQQNVISPLQCNFTFPKGDSWDGMCHLTRWPAPWPWKIADPAPPTSASAQCVPLTAPVCADAGYDFTAKFPPVEHDGKPYQQIKGESIEFYLQYLKLCSPYSSAIMCSLQMPKCVEGVERPILPCRSVCLEFTHQCKSLLTYASHAGLFRALCDLLPEQDLSSNTCFVPDGFKPSSNSVTKRDDCQKVVKPNFCATDLHYDQTFVPVADQAGITAILQPILDSKCSKDLEKYLCYTSVPPCKPNDLSVYVPCRDVCEQVKRDCGGEFLKIGIPMPDCTWIYPDGSDPTGLGLCRLTAFPAPWPSKIVVDPTAVAHKKASNKGGVIAAIVIVLGLVIAGVIVAVMYFRWRQGNQQFISKRFENVDPLSESNA